MNNREQVRGIRRAWSFVFATLASLALAAAASGAFASHAFALNGPDLETPCSLTVHDKNAGVHYSLYAVGAVTDAGDLVWSDAMLDGFDALGVKAPSLEKDQEAAAWRDAGKAANEVIAAQKLNPAFDAVTDAQASASFESVTAGLYLLVGQPWEDGAFAYEYTPMLVALPAWDSVACVWDSSATVEPKYSKTEITQPVTPPSNELSNWGDVANALVEFVKTGDVRYPVVLIAVIGLLAGIVAWRVRQNQD